MIQFPEYGVVTEIRQPLNSIRRDQLKLDKSNLKNFHLHIKFIHDKMLENQETQAFNPI